MKFDEIAQFMFQSLMVVPFDIKKSAYAMVYPEQPMNFERTVTGGKVE